MKVADKFSLAVATYQRQAIDQVVAKLAPDTPLKAIVAGPEVQTALAAFERADAEALMAQIRYRRWNWRGLSATTFGILVGAVLLFPIDALIEGIPRRAIGALQTLALLISAIATLVMSKMKPLDAWREDRGKAEDRRTEIFQTILQSPVRSELAADGATGKLAIVKVAYLENQLAYFDRRGREHVKLSGKARPMQIVAYLMIGIATLLGAAAFLHGLDLLLPSAVKAVVDMLIIGDESRWQLGITTVASGILAHATARTLLDEDERKAKLYEVTGDRLRAVLQRITLVQTAAARGDEGPLLAFFHDTKMILQHEHTVWSFLRASDEDGDVVAP